MPTRLQIARPDIIRHLDSLRQGVLQRRDLQQILNEKRSDWRLAQATTAQDLIRYLSRSSRLARVELPFPNRKEIRYTWGEVPLPTVLLTLRPQCHFSHYTAVRVHELTEQDPKTIYVNHEQPRKSAPGELVQARIDSAFARKPRVSANVAEFGDFRICLLNGMRTDCLGVGPHVAHSLADGASVEVRVTDIERTLIDIAVRPFYAGGVHEVLKAYTLAAPRVSVNRLAAVLQQIGYTYPYHQSVGFYLDRSGAFKPSVIDRFRRRFSPEFDFYLTYQMGQTRFDERWRLHVPAGM